MPSPILHKEHIQRAAMKDPKTSRAPQLPQYCPLSRFNNATFNVQNSEKIYPSVPEHTEKHYRPSPSP